MSGMTVRLVAVSLLLMGGGLDAFAQPTQPSEDVTVTATKRDVLHDFAKTFAAPTKLSGKIARWESRLCPAVMGQESDFNSFIQQRIKFVALAVGARINAEPDCKPNIDVVFTTTPQALLDNIRQHQWYYLGYAEPPSQLDKLATVTRPVQAWYYTATRDCNGRLQADTNVYQSTFSGNLMTDRPTYAACFGRINDGLRTGFRHVVIVIDSAKLAGEKIVPLADYISMLALTQLDSQDACQKLPSIVNMMASGCDRAGDGLTEYDLAYLKGLYNMNADRMVLFERNDIGDTMKDTLEKTK